MLSSDEQDVEDDTEDDTDSEVDLKEMFRILKVIYTGKSHLLSFVKRYNSVAVVDSFQNMFGNVLSHI